MKKITIVTLIIATILGWQYFNLTYLPVNKGGEDIQVHIKSGEKVKEIAQKLKELGLIKSENAFYFYAKNQNLGEKIIAGRFYLNSSMNIPEIFENITKTTQGEISFTIQEGLMVREIDKKLTDLNLIENGEFIKATQNFSDYEKYPFISENLKKLTIPLEGYIYPDTYFLDGKNFTPEELIYKTLNNYQKKTEGLNVSHEILTMASIIENEVFGAEDRKIVSGILWKRLKNNWTIGADITLIYITEDRNITAVDLAIDSPYNTRKNKGLPPGPISNPSIESIKAALNPKESPYWFYLTTLDTGEVIYAETNEQHNLNRQKYL